MRNITIKITDKLAALHSDLEHQRPLTEQIKNFLDHNQDEIDYVAKLLENSIDIQLPHHHKGYELSYEEEGKKPVILKHSYYKIKDKIYVKFQRQDVLGRGQFGIVKQMYCLNDKKMVAIKLLENTSDANKKTLDFKLILEEGDIEPSLFNRLESVDDFAAAINATTAPMDANATAVSDQECMLEIKISPNITLIPLSNRQCDLHFSRHYLIMDYAQMDLAHYAQKIVAEASDKNLYRNNAVLLRNLLKLPSLIVDALNKLHTGALSKTDMSYVHSDIKPANILIISDDPNNFRVGLCDFDSCLPIADHEKNPIEPFAHGTPGYIAPELPQSQKERNRGAHYTIASDIFALGKTLEEMIHKIYCKEQWNQYRESLLVITKKMQNEIPDFRPSLSEVKLCFEEAEQRFLVGKSQQSELHANIYPASPSIKSPHSFKNFSAFFSPKNEETRRADSCFPALSV